MKNSDFERTIGLAFVALSLVAKVFSNGSALSDFSQGVFIGLGMVLLTAGLFHARQKAKTLC